MGEIILKIQNVSKQYRLGQIGTGTISHDLNRWWAKIRGKEDPFLKIGESNDREKKGDSEYVWALKDINFEVQKGEVLGIIGKNGAGKSTLLKILSRVTSPTTGSIKTKGRIASLLEVGTGFHPEMTGRENIYLNGAILGMTKKEIASKIEEIIAFSGCERYIDTPVKRYSSGMTVRLAFAVAAHLDPEILVVDEVLAVGDAEFQKKAIGKMQDISKDGGRTVLFVSHNMAAVETLCTRVIRMKNGTIVEEGNPVSVIARYLQESSTSNRKVVYDTSLPELENDAIKIHCAEVQNATAANKENVLDVTSEIHLYFEIENKSSSNTINVGLDLLTMKGEVVFGTGSKFEIKQNEILKTYCVLPANFLNDDLYQVYFYIHSVEMRDLYSHKDLLSFEVKDVKRESGYLGKINGVIRPKLNWEIK